MIEKILRVKAKTFRYGIIVSYSAADQRAVVEIGETTVTIKTAMSLSAGDTVTLAKNDQDKSWIVVESSGKAFPSQATLLLI